MQGTPAKVTSDNGLPLPPYAVYNIGGGTPENLLDYICTLQEELVRAGVLPEDYNFEAPRELVCMRPGDIPVTYAESSTLEKGCSFRPTIGIREGLRKFIQRRAFISIQPQKTHPHYVATLGKQTPVRLSAFAVFPGYI